MSKKQLDEYIPNTIQSIRKNIPEQVENYYTQFPFEKYGDPFIRRKLQKLGVRQDRVEYQDCYEAATMGYLYSIHRCALMQYEYIVPYIRKMIKVCIFLGWNISQEIRHLCEENNFSQISLDKEESRNRY